MLAAAVARLSGSKMSAVCQLTSYRSYGNQLSITDNSLKQLVTNKSGVSLQTVSPIGLISTRGLGTRVPRGAADRRKQQNIGLAGVVFLIVPITTFCLGVWQYRRRAWKLDKIQELEQKVRREEPINITQGLDDPGSYEYRRGRARGSFDYSKEIFIGPRSLLDTSGGTTGGIISSGDKVGWHVISPFHIENGPVILVNRGWLPRSKLDPASRMESQIQGPRDIVGVIRVTEETSSLTPPNKVESNRWQSRDVKALASRLGTSDLFLDLEATSGDKLGGPVAGQTRISLRNDHVQYMLTWFGLSVGSLLLWLKRFVW